MTAALDGFALLCIWTAINGNLLGTVVLCSGSANGTKIFMGTDLKLSCGFQISKLNFDYHCL